MKQSRNQYYIEIQEDKKDELEQFIRASLLGDGSIPKLRGTNCHLSFGHSEKQLPYLEWKRDFLRNFHLANNISKYTHNSPRYKSGSCISYHLHSKTHPIFTEFRTKYYQDRKIINREDFIKLNEFGLAIWYMDDGNIWKQKGSSVLTINTQCFNEEEVKFMIDFLIEKWGFRCTLNKNENTIRISALSADKFISIIKPYIVKCMEYKGVLVKSGELLEALQVMGNQQPSLISGYLKSKLSRRFNDYRVSNTNNNPCTSARQLSKSGILVIDDIV
jgi:hypothetical protein